MARYTDQSRIARNSVSLFSVQTSSLEKNPPPGQQAHKRRKSSEYGVQLREKQKAKYTYGVLCEAVPQPSTRPPARKASPGEILFQLRDTSRQYSCIPSGHRSPHALPQPVSLCTPPSHHCKRRRCNDTLHEGEIRRHVVRASAASHLRLSPTHCRISTTASILVRGVESSRPASCCMFPPVRTSSKTSGEQLIVELVF